MRPGAEVQRIRKRNPARRGSREVRRGRIGRRHSVSWHSSSSSLCRPPGAEAEELRIRAPARSRPHEQESGLGLSSAAKRRKPRARLFFAAKDRDRQGYYPTADLRGAESLKATWLDTGPRGKTLEAA